MLVHKCIIFIFLLRCFKTNYRIAKYIYTVGPLHVKLPCTIDQLYLAASLITEETGSICYHWLGI